MVGRDEQGHFVKGNKLSAGNRGGRRARRETEAEYATVLRANVSMVDFAAIVRSQVEDALHCIDASDRLAAAKFLVAYLIGQPRQSIEIEAQLTIDAVEIFAEMRKTLRGANGHRDMEPK